MCATRDSLVTKFMFSLLCFNYSKWQHNINDLSWVPFKVLEDEDGSKVCLRLLFLIPTTVLTFGSFLFHTYVSYIGSVWFFFLLLIKHSFYLILTSRKL